MLIAWFLWPYTGLGWFSITYCRIIFKDLGSSVYLLEVGTPMTSSPEDKPQEPGKVDLFNSIPKNYRRAWDTLSDSQKMEACVLFFKADLKDPQKKVIKFVSSHRRWGDDKQSNEIIKNLTVEDKAEAVYSVTKEVQLAAFFYICVVREWLVSKFLIDIGKCLDRFGISNDAGSLQGFNEIIEVDKLKKLFIHLRDNPAEYTLCYLTYIFLDAEGKKSIWQNAHKALEEINPKTNTVSTQISKLDTSEKALPNESPFSKLSLYESSLIKSLVADAISRTSRLSAEEAQQMILQLIDVSPNHSRHCYLLGFAQALYKSPIKYLDIGLNSERKRWHVAGYLMGLSRSFTKDEVYKLMMLEEKLLDHLLENDKKTHPELFECSILLSETLFACDDYTRFQALLEVVQYTPIGYPIFNIINVSLDLVSKLASVENYKLAIEIVDKVTYILVKHEIATDYPELTESFNARIEYNKASLLLGLKKYSEAQAIYAKIINNPESLHRMGARVWMSLSKAGVNRIEDTFPHGTKDRFDSIIAKLAIVARDVADRDESQHRLALICNGLWQQHSGKHKEAIKSFTLALQDMPPDSNYRQRKIEQWTNLCRAISYVYELNDECLNDIKVAFQEACDAGIKPASWYLLPISSQISMFGDSDLFALFSKLLPEGDLPSFNKAQWEAGTVKSDTKLQPGYLTWLESSDLPFKTKWSQAGELLERGWKQGGLATEMALDFLSYYAFTDAPNAEKLIQLLDKLGPSEEMLLEHEIKILKARLYASSSQVPQATALLTGLFFNIANSEDPYLKQMSLAVYEDINEMKGDTKPLEDLWKKIKKEFEPQEVDPDDIKSAGEIKLLYVGGTEVQIRYEEEIKEEFAEKYPNVSIQFFYPGWTSNWNKFVDVIRPRIAESDGMLLSYYVRTMFGRTIRKLCSDNCPWWGANGHGKASISRGLTEAAHKAAQRKSKNN